MKRILLTAYFICAVMLAYGQHTDSRKLESTIGLAIKKACPASLRIYGYDTVSKQQMSAQFSGVVVSKDGDILTAAHVELPGKTYKVRFPDGREAIAIGLGKIEFAADKTMPDVAMMKIITVGVWPCAALGSSANLKQHEPCISIAYPESLNQLIPTVRFGRIEDVKNSRGFIQSSCKMEPGDSGGPLFDDAGRVIGMHSAIEVAESSNYEIPVDMYRKYWTALHRPEIYTALPKQVDVFKDENEVSKFKIDDLSVGLQIGSKFKGTYLSVKSIVDGKPSSIMGTLFTLKGMDTKYAGSPSLLVSKNSMVGSEPTILLANGKLVAATVLARDKENDLVLLRLAVGINGGIPVKELAADTLHPLIPGKFLLSPQPDSAVVVSALGMGIITLPKNTNMAFLGAAIAYGDGPLKITRVMDASPASKCGLQIGDEVLSIDHVPMTRAEDYGNQLIKYWSGDTVTIRVNQQGNQLDKTVILGNRPQPVANHPVEFFAGGKSARRDGFKAVFTHDGKLIPAMCGGPVFDIDGYFLGINIARFGRATSLAMPVIDILNFIKWNIK